MDSQHSERITARFLVIAALLTVSLTPPSFPPIQPMLPRNVHWVPDVATAAIRFTLTSIIWATLLKIIKMMCATSTAPINSMIPISLCQVAGVFSGFMPRRIPG